MGPGSGFADIEAIYQAQWEAGEPANHTDESDGSELSSESGGCIVVASRRVEE